jgi:transcription-repair coupling factor (superfamily II helicase)
MVKLSKMGGADWNRAKSKAKASTKEMAKELIELYARRKRTPGIRFDPDDEMCREFADSFQYEETDSQLQAISDIRNDMEQDYPMDRLLCGDVGYGKTEVALRAAFKAVMSGKQVAVLVPTTILAYQHYQTFLSRMRSFPVNIDMVSRFRTPKEQAASIRKVARGDTDIIIGTHRLISKDVQFYDLGIVQPCGDGDGAQALLHVA